MKKEVSLTAKQGSLLREFIFGLNDGLVSTLSLLAGLSGALISNNIIILGGLAEIVAGSISMGLGAYISTKSEEEYYKSKIAKEKKSIEDIPSIEIKELKDLYRKKGFNKKEINLIVNKITKHKATWLDTLIHEKIGIEENFEDPKKMGLTNGLYFIIGGLFPILPFFFFQASFPLLMGTVFALIVLFIIGILKSRSTGRNWFVSGLELAVICLIAASLSYLAGKVIINL